VLIGNSATAIGAVESIRRYDATGDITLLSDEPYATYSRPLISYLLLGKTTRQGMAYRPEHFYADNRVHFLPGKRAERIDAQGKRVLCADGGALPYDRLLVATGSSPLVPPMQGLDRVARAYTFASLDDALALQAALTPQSRVLIVGAGLIGLKCAEGISRLAADIAVVDLAPRVLSSILDEESASLVQRKLEENGLRFYLGDSVQTFSPDAATLRSGTVVPFDTLVLAIGVRPNTGLLADIGGKVGRGIAVDARMRTSVPDIYAAGDCTESVDASTGETKVMALLPNAYMQGECAGANMAGQDAVFDKGIPMNAIGFFGTHILTAGSYRGDTYVERGEGCLRKLFYSDNRLNGFILVESRAGARAVRPVYDKAGIYTSLIREGTPLDTLDFDLILQAPGLVAFSRADRLQKLGGAPH
jgi:NAD(P)H-nitrite reductase large subunit